MVREDFQPRRDNPLPGSLCPDLHPFHTTLPQLAPTPLLPPPTQQLTQVQAGLLHGPAPPPHFPGQLAQVQLSPHWQLSPQVQSALPHGPPPPAPHAAPNPTSSTAAMSAFSMQQQLSPQEHFPSVPLAHLHAVSSLSVVTVAVCVSRETTTSVTPSTPRRAPATVEEQPPHVIFFVIESVWTGIVERLLLQYF